MTTFPTGFKYTLGQQGSQAHACLIGGSFNIYNTSAYNTTTSIDHYKSKGYECVSHLNLRTGQPVKNSLSQLYTKYACMSCINTDNNRSGGNSTYNLIGPNEASRGITCQHPNCSPYGRFNSS